MASFQELQTFIKQTDFSFHYTGAEGSSGCYCHTELSLGKALHQVGPSPGCRKLSQPFCLGSTASLSLATLPKPPVKVWVVTQEQEQPAAAGKV